MKLRSSLRLKLRCKFCLFSSIQTTETYEMATLVSERVGIKKTGVTTSVPPNSKAKLMYYLDCVATLIELNNPNLRRLRGYQTYYLLNDAETDALLAFVLLFSPDKLIGKVMFHSEDCGGSRNEFYG